MSKETCLCSKHIELGAKMVDFAGWFMPVQYSSIIDEHKNVRENVGLFDVSHMGEIFISGKDSVDFLNSVVPQAIDKLDYEKAVYCQLPNDNGGLIDDLIIYRLGIDLYLVICNASRIDEDINRFYRLKKSFDVKIENKSEEYSLLAVQGPKAYDLMKNLGYDLVQDSFTMKLAKIAGYKMYISRTGYTGEDGFELLMENSVAPLIWDKILEVGKEFNICPVGLGARDSLRLEAALPLYGNDLDENTSPVESGLKWSIPKDKIQDYPGKGVILQHYEYGGNKKLIGIRMTDKSIARHGYEVFFNDEKVGIVTSGGVSPSTSSNIALCYVKNIKEICIGSTLEVMIREKLHQATVVKLPFIEKHNRVKNKKN